MRHENSHAHDESSSRGASNEDCAWYHFMFSTYGAWLRGDARGFRDHGHRIHSSGDYRNPPPADEHAGLRTWTKRAMRKPAVSLTPDQRREALAWLVRALRARGVELLALAVMAQHVHGLGRFEVAHARRVIGLAKARSSHALRDAIPGAVWAKKCALRLIRDRLHQATTFRYIINHEREGGKVWTFRDV
ncbi:MAG: hypothetical protein ACKVW3_01535 [Phycisphaerales bacterium]